MTSVTYNGIFEPENLLSFSSCSKLTSVNVPANYKGGDTFCGIKVNKIDEQIIYTGNCGDNVTYKFDGETLTISGSGKMTDYSNVSSVPWNAYKDFIERVVIKYEDGDDVTSIGDNAFSGCSKLESVTIPDSVTSIRSGVFDGCSGLQSINVSEDNANYKSEDGILFSKDGATLILYPAGKTDTSYSIPDNVQTIENNAFEGCSKFDFCNHR